MKQSLTTPALLKDVAISASELSVVSSFESVVTLNLPIVVAGNTSAIMLKSEIPLKPAERVTLIDQPAVKPPLSRLARSLAEVVAFGDCPAFRQIARVIIKVMTAEHAKLEQLTHSAYRLEVGKVGELRFGKHRSPFTRKKRRRLLAASVGGIIAMTTTHI